MGDYKMMFKPGANPALALYRYWNRTLRGAGKDPGSQTYQGLGLQWGLEHSTRTLGFTGPNQTGHPPNTIHYGGLFLRSNGDFMMWRPWADHGRNFLRDHSFLNWGYLNSGWVWWVDITRDLNRYGGHINPGSPPLYVTQDVLVMRHWGNKRWWRLEPMREEWRIVPAPTKDMATIEHFEWSERVRIKRMNRYLGVPRRRRMSDVEGMVRIGREQMTIDDAAVLMAVHFDLLAPAKRSTTEAQEATTDGTDCLDSTARLR